MPISLNVVLINNQMNFSSKHQQKRALAANKISRGEARTCPYHVHPTVLSTSGDINAPNRSRKQLNKYKNKPFTRSYNYFLHFA